MAEKRIPHLGAVSVANHNIVAAFNEVPKLRAGERHVLGLLLKSSLLAGPEERVAAKGYHSEFCHISLFLMEA